MSLTKITDASLQDVKGILSRALTGGIQSPAVRRLSEQAIVGNPDHISAIYYFVKGTFPYISDPSSGELFVHPNRMAEDYFSGRIRGEDCDGHALLNAAMLGSIGYKTRLTLMDSDLDGELDHAVAEAYSEALSDWITVDTTSNLPLGWRYQFRKVTYVRPS